MRTRQGDRSLQVEVRRELRPGRVATDSVRVVRQPRGDYVQLVCKINREMEGCDAAIGIDVGVQDRAVLSNGRCIEKARRRVKYLKRVQRRVARSKKGGGSRKRKVMLLKKEHHRIRVRERNVLHRETTQIVRQDGRNMVIEDLKIKNMTASAKGTVESPGSRVKQKAGLNRSILEQCWGEFVTQLEYKCVSAGGRFLRVDPKQTLRTCSRFGARPEDRLTLEIGTFRCTKCGYLIERDLNAANNILLKA